jgi:dienelactone hydrolase
MIRTIETRVHGRFLHEDRGRERLLVGFHGYAETAEIHLEELKKLPGADDWSLLAVQALHPFYTRGGTAVVASWMTGLDRQLAIADNLAYVRAVLATLPTPRVLVFLGFSQGAAMAARAAAFAGAKPAAIILLGGDIPPEVAADAKVSLPPVLLARGTKDDWYTEEKFKQDLSFLEAKTAVTPCAFDGGHEFNDAFRAAAGDFLRGL